MPPIEPARQHDAVSEDGTKRGQAQADLVPIATEAIQRWLKRLPYEPIRAALTGVNFVVGGLPGNALATISGSTITVDANAAGFGWFVDTTPQDDIEVQHHVLPTSLYAQSNAAAARMDLLTTIMHELSHRLGIGHFDNNSEELMSESLPVGARRLPNEIFAPHDASHHGHPQRRSFDQVARWR